MGSSHGTITLTDIKELKYLWENDSGTHMASGLADVPFNIKNPDTYGYNSIYGTGELQFKYNKISLASLGEYGLKIFERGNNYPIAEFGSEVKLYRPGRGELTDPSVRITSSGASFDGAVVARSLTIGSGSTAYDGEKAINANGYTIEIINDAEAAPSGTVIPEGSTYIYPILYLNGQPVSSSEITYTHYIWYKNNGSIGIAGDSNKGGIVATYGHTYRATYDFTDDEVGTAPTVQVRNVDPSKYITQISDDGITVHPEDTSNNNYLQIADSIEIYNNNISIAQYGATTRIGIITGRNVYIDSNGINIRNGSDVLANFGDSITIGQDNNSRVLINSNGILLYQSNNNVAQFGTTARIGIINSSRFLMNSNSLEGYDSNNQKYFEVNNNGLTWGNNTAATTLQVSEAEKTATNYISTITGGGITVHDEDDMTNYVQIDSSGMNIVKNNISVAKFGTISRLGKEFDVQSDDNESYIELDYHSMRMIDLENSTYFYISDLRNTEGQASIVDNYAGDNNTKKFNLSLIAWSKNYSVTVNGEEVTEGITKTTDSFTFNVAPSRNSKIVASYITTSNYAKAYTTGIRATESPYSPIAARVGAMSFAEGIENVASGFASHVGGNKSIAEGKYSLAYGNSVYALGDKSIALGQDCFAEGEYSHAEGWSSVASGQLARAYGHGCSAEGMASYAAGAYCEALQDYCHAEGYDSTAGTSIELGGKGAVAIGKQVSATGDYSVALNYGTNTTRHSQIALGEYNILDDYIESGILYTTTSSLRGKYIVIVGNGRNYNNRSNAFTIDWNGNIQYAGSSSQMSDRRLKDHISYLDKDAIDFVQSLKPVHFNKDKQSHVGFYAQDVEKIDPWNCLTGEMNEFKTLNYIEIIAPLVAYCQHLEERIKKLEEKE